MKSRFKDASLIARIFWVLALTSIFIWSLIPSYDKGWDVDVYKNAMVSLRAGHDPYADAIAVQTKYQADPHRYELGDPIPYSYVYSPITLPLLRWLSKFPFVVIGSIYWTFYVVAAALMIWVGMQFVEEREKGVFGIISSVVIFFPGMLENDVLFSGNIAYILYAAVLAGAWVGWKKNRWLWFYAAVLVAGCCKAPMLSLLAIPVLSARKQWINAALTGATGLAMFAMQPRIWPELFRHYMTAVDLQFAFNRDFSSSPAGLVTNALFNVVPYKQTSVVAYLVCAACVGGTLFYLSRKFFAGAFSLKQWVPLLLVGVILLNPRIMEYDIVPITLPVTLVAWRFFARGKTLQWTIAFMALFFAILNTLAAQSHSGLTNPPWKLTAGFMLMTVFFAGAWNLAKAAHEAGPGTLRDGLPKPMSRDRSSIDEDAPQLVAKA